MSAPAHAFRSRQTRPLGVEEVRGWSLKWYEINVDPEPIDEVIVMAARDLVRATTAAADVDPALGFLIVHQGEEAVWLLRALWRADILYQRTLGAPLSDPTRFEAVGADGPTACVWELAVHAHERDALVAHVLSRPDRPDVAAYLSDVITVEAQVPA